MLTRGPGGWGFDQVGSIRQEETKLSSMRIVSHFLETSRAALSYATALCQKKKTPAQIIQILTS